MYLYVPVYGTILLMEIRFKKEKSRNIKLNLMAQFLETHISPKQIYRHNSWKNYSNCARATGMLTDAYGSLV